MYKILKFKFNEFSLYMRFPNKRITVLPHHDGLPLLRTKKFRKRCAEFPKKVLTYRFSDIFFVHFLKNFSSLEQSKIKNNKINLCNIYVIMRA